MPTPADFVPLHRSGSRGVARSDGVCRVIHALQSHRTRIAGRPPDFRRPTPKPSASSLPSASSAFPKWAARTPPTAASLPSGGNPGAHATRQKSGSKPGAVEPRPDEIRRSEPRARLSEGGRSLEFGVWSLEFHGCGSALCPLCPPCLNRIGRFGFFCAFCAFLRQFSAPS